MFSPGAVAIVGGDGVADTWTFTADMTFPALVTVAVRQVKATGTTVVQGGIKAVW